MSIFTMGIDVGSTASKCIILKDGKEIVLGQKFFYSFDGSLITANRAEDLFEYKFVDDYQETHDRFDGVYKVIAKKDFKTADGKQFKKGDDLTSYSFLKEDKTKGKLEVGLKEEFLSSTVRVSFSKYNNKEELDFFLANLKELIPQLRRYK